MVSSETLYGPWIRQERNPVHLKNNPTGYLEQPIIYKFNDGSFGAFYDPINNTHFYLFFSGYQPSQAQRYESFGVAKLAFLFEMS